ncbi:MAG TPA: hypothetical protein VLK27_08240 [Chthoniobacterales bacterium]|nr:hypothetical protein [Chthoniobacterales bacterium]
MNTKSCLLAVVCLGVGLALAGRAPAQTVTTENVVVTGENDIRSAYGAPGTFSRTRFSPTTTAYVLPPYQFLFATIYEGDGFQHGPPDHLFTQELEMGLPYRFGVAAETELERFHGGGGFETVSLEGRYALADWDKIPLNPTLFVEYKFGVGPIRHEEGPPPPPGEEEEAGPPQIPNAYELRILLSEEFCHRWEWALNGFFEKENTGDRGREIGFAQSIMTPVLLPNEQLKVGVEMEYKNFSVKDTRGNADNIFVIGPTAAYRTSTNTRFEVSSLFGCTNDSPHAQVFAVFSWLLGPPGPGEQGEAPVSTRNR